MPSPGYLTPALRESLLPGVPGFVGTGARIQSEQVPGFRRNTQDAPGRGRRVSYGQDFVEKVVATTLREPPAGITHWSTRTLASHLGVSHGTIHEIWRDMGLQPHRTRTFKYSRDPHLEEKVTDVVGLYMNPPENALVLCMDEKTQIQALDRTQPLLPMRPHQVERRTHDYKRHGITSLFAALEVASGEVTGACYPRHRHEEFLAFLRLLTKVYPGRELNRSWTTSPRT